MNNERRHYSRITFHTAAQLITTEDSIDVVVVDLSLKGALVRLPTGTLLNNETPCTLRVRLDDDGDQIRMETQVTHVQGCYAGLKCQSIDIDSVTHLRRLVELNLGDEKLLERELSALLSE